MSVTRLISALHELRMAMSSCGFQSPVAVELRDEAEMEKFLSYLRAEFSDNLRTSVESWGRPVSPYVLSLMGIEFRAAAPIEPPAPPRRAVVARRKRRV